MPFRGHGWLSWVSNDAFINKDVFSSLVDILIDSTNVWPNDGLHRLVLGFLKKVWSQSIDHYLVVQSLIVKFLIQKAIVPVHLPLLAMDLLETLHLLLLLLSVFLQDVNFLSHLLLDEHVVLHAALKNLGDLSAFFADPASVTLLV